MAFENVCDFFGGERMKESCRDRQLTRNYLTHLEITHPIATTQLAHLFWLCYLMFTYEYRNNEKGHNHCVCQIEGARIIKWFVKRPGKFDF